MALINVTGLSDIVLEALGYPPNPAGWNCYDTEHECYGDAIWTTPALKFKTRYGDVLVTNKATPVCPHCNYGMPLHICTNGNCSTNKFGPNTGPTVIDTKSYVDIMTGPYDEKTKLAAWNKRWDNGKDLSFDFNWSFGHYNRVVL